MAEDAHETHVLGRIWNRKPRILITGASGMAGYAVCQEALAKGWEVLAQGRTDRHRLPGVHFRSCELLHTDEFESMVLGFRPDLLVHCAAQTEHRECERDPTAARALHVDVSGRLAHLVRSMEARMIHVSSEAVYGNAGPFRETDELRPEGVYAETKAEGERAVMAELPGALILRCTPVGFAPSLAGRSLVEWLLRSLRADDTIKGYRDAIFTPITSFQLARFVISQEAAQLQGIYNMGCAPPMSKFSFARRLCVKMGYPPERVIEASAPPGMAREASLISDSLLRQTGFSIPTDENVLDNLVEQFEKLPLE